MIRKKRKEKKERGEKKTIYAVACMHPPFHLSFCILEYTKKVMGVMIHVRLPLK